MEHPELLEHIPSGAEIILLPKDDPELYRVNLKTAQEIHRQDDAPPLVYVEIEALAPPRSRLVNPRLASRPISFAT